VNPLSLVPSWVWAAAVATLAATSCKLKIDLGSVQLELEKTKVVYEQERANQMAVLAQAQQRFRQSEQNLVEATVAIREETHAQVLASAAAADDLRRRLRTSAANAATAALVSSTVAASAPAAAAVELGAVIPDRVGDDLISLAERANEIRADAQACRRQYNAARSALEAIDQSSKVGNGK